jgi:hypothetical protein
MVPTTITGRVSGWVLFSVHDVQAIIYLFICDWVVYK